MVKISVIVPIYNVEQYLERCLLSIKNQIFSAGAYEVILVDDGSTDNSSKIAKRFVEEDNSKFVLVYQKNQGLSGARNRGILQASGKYICFVDSDDYLEPVYLQTMYEHAEKNNADLVFSDFRSVDEQGRVIREICEDSFVEEENYSIFTRADLLLIQNAAWNKLYKRSIVIEHDLLFELNVWYEDLRFVKKYLAVCERCVHCEKILYNYVLRSGSIMNSIGSERNIEIISAIKELREYYSKRFGDKFSKEIEFLAIDHMYITALVRLIRAHNTESKKILKEIEKEFKEMFPEYTRNPYIESLSKERKVIFKLLNLKMYDLIYLLFEIKRKINENIKR